MRFVVTGGTGFIGKAVVEELLTLPSAEVVVPSRSARRSASPRVTFVRWSAEESLDPALVNGVDAVIHLAGETAVGKRLTPQTKKEVRSSRLGSTKLLVEAMRAAPSKPRAFVCASAVGYYGARSDEETLDETATPGSDFLASLCVDWEKAAREASPLGVRVVNARLGIVLGKGGGALPKMAAPIRAFVGGTLGNGAQVVSWIHLRDVARALRFVATTDGISGAVNVTAPSPATNRELTAAIAKRLGRPALLSVPSFALRLALGEGADPLLTGQRVVPRGLLDAGFSFEFPSLEAALAEALD